jgi:MarR family transcriptional regulator, 2-MHQ and catechol-resistance regulon repressor
MGKGEVYCGMRDLAPARYLDEKNPFIRIFHLCLQEQANQVNTLAAGKLWIVLARCYKSLSLLVEESVSAEDLGVTDFMILEALLHKGPLTITEIQGKVLLASGSMTAAVDRLEDKGFICRKFLKSDRRARRLELTATGRRFIESIFERHMAELDGWMSVLSAAEKKSTYTALKKLGLHAASLKKD